MLVPDSQFSQNQTQTQQTQPQTQQHSQPFPRGVWGVLVSCAPQIPAGSAQDYVERPARVELIVGKDSYTIGRDPRSDIILAGKKISAKQARIYVLEDGGLRLEDTSTNGTYVRGSRVGKKNTTTLLNGDEIVFGPATSSLLNDFRYIFQSPSTNPPAFHTTESPSGINVLYDLRGATKIGKGSFATVYSVIRRLDGTKVAVKIIQKKRFRDQPKTMAMLRREIEVLKLLNHKYCVEYLDFFEDDESIMIVTEFVAGGDLLERIMSKHGISEVETRSIAKMVCQALAYLHSQGIAHRDIKPENLLLSEPGRGGGMICKLTDFGLAKVASEQSKLKTLCGTPSYLAPEVILGTVGTYDTAVDLFSLGVVLYSCLTNSTPFDESESTPLPERMRLRVVDFDELRAVQCSEVAIAFISKLLIADPALRMTAAEALRDPWLATIKPTETQKKVPILSPAALLTSDGSFGYSNLCLDSPQSKVAINKMDEGKDETARGTAMISILDTSKEATISALPRPSYPISVPLPLASAQMTLDSPLSNKRKQGPSSAFSSGSSLSLLSSRESSPMEIASTSRTTRRSPRKSNPRRSSTSLRDHSTATTVSAQSTSMTVTKESLPPRASRRISAGTPRPPPAARSTPRRSVGRNSVDRSANGKEQSVEMEASPVVSLRKSTRVRKVARTS